MAKIRIHELAKELELSNNDVKDYVNSLGVEVKTASSGVEDDVADKVRAHFGKGAKKEEAPKAEAEVKVSAPEKKPAEKKPVEKRPEEKKPEDNKAEAPAKKKPSVTMVINRDNLGGSNKRRPRPARDNAPETNAPHRPIKPRTQPNGGARGTSGIIRPRQGVDHIREKDHAVEENLQPVVNEAHVQRKEAAEPQRPKIQIPRENVYRNSNSDGDKAPQRRRPDDRPQGQSQGQSQGHGGYRQNDQRNGQNQSQNNGQGQGQKTGKGGRTNPKNKQQRDFDSLGGKKQERFLNLEKNGGKKKGQKTPTPKDKEEEIKSIKLPELITIRDLADRMKMNPSQIIKTLFMKGQVVTLNTELSYEDAENIAVEYDILCEPEEKVDVIAELLKEDDEDEKKMVSRPPVVCVMGHVDHGKTSLLDAIRDTKVTDREAGGITQAIGAYVVKVNDQKITFLDTPGHEAFTAMRMRGANSTDIAILVVAADDGVMPQTVEAINHAKAAGVEIIVAINKIDKPNANVDRVKQELSEYELIPEDWGGSTVFVPVSAHTHEGIDTLLDMILLTAEVLELKANPKRNARGLVIEAELDKGRGTVATVLVQKGTLHVGDPIAAGSSYGKVRAMIDDNGRRVKSAGPSTPVEILGLSEVPNAGEIFVAMDSEKDARNFAETFISEGKNKLVEDTKMKMSLDDLYSQIQSGNVKELNIIVKADVQGSVEAIKQSLVKLSNEEVMIKIIHGGVGAITESDVVLASASNAIIIGFNVRPDAMAKQTADTENVDIRLYSVIYNAIEDVEAAMKGMLDPVYEEKVIGHAEVRQIFKASDVGSIAGSYVTDGMFQRGCKVRVSRDGEQIFEGDLASLKRFKDDVKEVKTNYECGIVIDGFNEIQEGDIIEAYTMVEVAR
ncbi:MAG: translation initiation factor IF-2 [Lachnospiraceae bacterium]|nr:translation initiation factor IF-2 [Lachnospiraceae bacterium]